MSNSKIIDTLTEGVRTSGELALSLMNTSSVKYKEDKTAITESDTAVQEYLAKYLDKHFPSHGIIGEEGQLSKSSDNGMVWHIDPIDGTENYSRNLPFWAVSVALVRGNEPTIGCVYSPDRDEMFVGAKGEGALLNGGPIRVSDRGPSMAMVTVGRSPSDMDRTGERSFMGHKTQAFAKFRRISAASLELAYLAAGRIEGFVEFGASSWDYAAGACIAREAGARITKFDGAAWDVDSNHFVASNDIIHEELLSLVKSINS